MEPKLCGDLTNGFFQLEDKRVFFLPYDPMRQFRSKAEIDAEIKQLIDKRECLDKPEEIG